MLEKLPPISFRQIKVIACVARCGSLAAAGNILGRSASAIGKSVKEFEAAIGEPVFEIASQKRVPRPEFADLFQRADTILGLFEDLAKEYQRSHSRPRDVRSLPLFSMDLSSTRLRKLAILDETHSIEETARVCGQSASAVYKFLHELEDQLQSELFARLPQGRYIPISFGEYLCRRIRLALSELRLAYDEVQAASGTEGLRLVIGCLPSMRPNVLPNAIARMNALDQNWRIRIETGVYTQMADNMLRGDVDIIIGGTLLLSDTEELQTYTLAQDRICILARTGHPFIERGLTTAHDLNSASWVLPLRGTPSRKKFVSCLADSGVEVSQEIEISVPTALRGLLLSSDALTMGTYFQSQFDRSHGHLGIVPFSLVGDEYPIGYTLRKSTQPSTALRAFIDCLTSAIEDSKRSAFEVE